MDFKPCSCCGTRYLLDVVLEIVELLKRFGGDVDVQPKCEQITVRAAELLLHFFQRLLALTERKRNIFTAALGVQLAPFLHTGFQIVHLPLHDFHGFRLVHAIHVFADGDIVGVVEQIGDKLVVAFIGEPLDKHHA